MLAGVPFDLRLVQPLSASDYAWQDFASPAGVPVAYIDRLLTFALRLEDTLQTAIILSLFTNARARADDVLPLHSTERSGWVGDEFQGNDFEAGDAWGSRLWLYYTGKATGNVLEAARFAAQESLEWMLRDGVASRVDVMAQWVGERSDRLAIRPQIYQGDLVNPAYDVLWGTSVRSMAFGAMQ